MYPQEDALTFLLNYVVKHGDSIESPKAQEHLDACARDVPDQFENLRSALDSVGQPADPDGLKPAREVDPGKDAGSEPADASESPGDGEPVEE